MNIYGLLNYDTYSKIPITEEQFFDEYEYNIEGMFNGITLKNRICKTLKRGTDTIWLQEYLRIITQYTTRLTNQGEEYTDEEIFELFKLVCVRDRFYCLHGIDIFEGVTGELKDIIQRQSECYINNLCDDVFQYENILTNSVVTGYVFYSNDVYDYDNFIPYRKVDTLLIPILFTSDENGITINKTQGDITILPIDIVIKHGNCFYDSIGEYSDACVATATGVYKANGDYEITISPTTTSASDFKVIIDGVERTIDGTNIIYSNGVITVKNAYNNNQIALTGCPVMNGTISKPCSYTITDNSTSELVSITIGGATPLPTAAQLKIFIDSSEFSTQLYTYDPNTGVITFTINEAYYNKAFTIRIATCIFGFAIDKDDEDIVVTIDPTINNYTYTACDGCDKVTYSITYVLDPEAAIENTYKPVSTETLSATDGCKESYNKETYYCSNGKKYLVTTPYTKCYNDSSWTEGTPSDPVEQADPAECEKPTIADEEYWTCDGCDKITHTISYTYNEDTHEYDKEDTEVITTDGCKETMEVIENICKNGVAYIRTTPYTKCNGASSWTEGTASDEIGGTADCQDTVTSLERCNVCDKEIYSMTTKYDTDTNTYSTSTSVTSTITNGCKESYTIAKFICLDIGGGTYQLQEYRLTYTKCPPATSWTADPLGWQLYGTSFSDVRCNENTANYEFAN